MRRGTSGNEAKPATMRLLTTIGLAVFALAAAGEALASPPAVSIQVSKARGAAPLDVTLTAAGDAAAYRWDLGDGTTAEGAVVQHVYGRGGAYTATVTAVGANGETAVARVSIAALAVSLTAPRRARYGDRARLRGRVVPAEPGRVVVLQQGERRLATVREKRGGRFSVRPRILSPAPFRAVFEDASSAPVSVAVRPIVRTAIDGPPIVGGRLVLVARVRPTAAGPLLVRVWQKGRERIHRTFTGRARVRLSTRSTGPIVARVSTVPASGFTSVGRRLRTVVTRPSLSLGSRGPSVLELERRLSALHYALPDVDGYYGTTTYEAVLAFQKVSGLSWTGRVTPTVWARLSRATIPKPRYRRGSHLEVDKGRQVLFDVVGGRVRRVIHVSTGATGNTPLGVWHVYDRVPGFNAISMYYSLFFLRGFAIHGYPSVPPFPASHGCVRTPLWIAPTIFAEHGVGTTIYVY